MNGMDRTTGKSLTGTEHLRQSIADILTTPIGSRIMRREYGSLLPDMIDQPQNPAANLRLVAAATSALMRWEPRLKLSRISISNLKPGQSLLDVTGEETTTGALLQLQVPLTMGAAS